MRRILSALAMLVLLAGPATAGERIVAIGGAVTEILYALGRGGDIVAVDSTSVYPEAAMALPQVGYLRTLAAEPIVSLAPDIVIAVDHAGPRQVLQQIAAAGFRVEFIPDDYSPEGVVEKIELVSALVGAKQAGEALAAQVRDDLDEFAAILKQAPETPSVLFILTASSGAPLAAGDQTAAAGIIALAGGRNAVTGYDGYKPLSTEAAIGLDPDLVIVAEHAIPLLGGIEMLPKRADLGQIPAVRDGRVMVVDANYLLGFGPRAVQAARELARRLHPSLAAELGQ